MNLLHIFTDQQYFIFSILERIFALVFVGSVIPLMVREARVNDQLRTVRLSLLYFGLLYSFVIVATGTYTWCLTRVCPPWLTDFRGEVAALNGLGMLAASVCIWLIYRKPT